MQLRLLLALALAGCSISDPSLLDPLRNPTDAGPIDVDADVEETVDAGPDPEDAGPPPDLDSGPPDQLAQDTCNSGDLHMITETTPDIAIDTTVLTNRTTVSCADSTGNDGFFAIRVEAGEYWHFHLRTDPTDPDALTRNPTLYLLNESCNPNACAQVSRRCSSSSDEHFAFIPDSSGTWRIGVDDGNTGGGRYLLDAIRPVCGNDVPEHGESCDGQEGCNEDCRWLINDESVSERIPNDNFIEANQIELPASNELEVQADLGGQAGCNYPDVFRITVPDGARLEVLMRDGGGTPCSTGAEAPFILELLNAAGTTRGGGEDGNGCPLIDESDLAGGSYFVQVTDDRLDFDSVQRYRLLFRITP